MCVCLFVFFAGLLPVLLPNCSGPQHILVLQHGATRPRLETDSSYSFRPPVNAWPNDVARMLNPIQPHVGTNAVPCIRTTSMSQVVKCTNSIVCVCVASRFDSYHMLSFFNVVSLRRTWVCHTFHHWKRISRASEISLFRTRHTTNCSTASRSS